MNGTNPERISRWFLPVSGELHRGGSRHALPDDHWAVPSSEQVSADPATAYAPEPDG